MSPGVLAGSMSALLARGLEQFRLRQYPMDLADRDGETPLQVHKLRPSSSSTRQMNYRVSCNSLGQC